MISVSLPCLLRAVSVLLCNEFHPGDHAPFKALEKTAQSFGVDICAASYGINENLNVFATSHIRRAGTKWLRSGETANAPG
jgi:hypothetical protein